MMSHRLFRGGELRRLPWLAVAGTLVLGGCDGLLEVTDPEFASPGSLVTEAALPTVVAGALGDFQIAYSGSGGDAFLSVVSVFSDEFYSSGTFTTRTATDQRDQFPTVQGNTSDGAFERLQLARRSLSEAAEVVAEVGGNPSDPRVARLKALEGFTLVALGEAFCSGIPVSTSRGGVPVEEGPPLSTEEIFRAAADRFDTALGVDAALNLAKVGKGRALLNAGDFAGAASAVAGVPTGFVYFIEHSINSSRQNNPIFSLQDNGRYSVSNVEGQNGLPFRSALDPRVPWVEDPSGGFDASIPLFIDLRYPSFGSDVPLADGLEARLIEAEAALRSNNVAGWLRILNDLRADVEGIMSSHYEGYSANLPANFPKTLAPLTDPGDPRSRVQLMFRERAFWLYTTGHRLGDLRRMVRQYNFSQDEVFPTGPYFKGGVFGDDVNFPIPFEEVNNSLFDLSGCSTTTA